MKQPALPQWTIDFCSDNLRDAAGAREAVQHLRERLDGCHVLYNEQSCIHACRPCHAGALIVRVKDDLITGRSNEEVINRVVALIKGV